MLPPGIPILMEFKVTPIGYIKSCFKEKFGTPRQSGLVQEAYSELKISPDFQPLESLQGLEGFSHVWLVWWFHQNRVSRFHAKVHPPRLEGKTMGLFATRTPHRPNPIGLSLVRLEEIKGDTLYFLGADLVDGTPILDIKPYLPQYESVPEARVGWLSDVNDTELKIVWTAQAQEVLNQVDQLTPNQSLRNLIEKTIQLDPRPVVYRGNEESGGAYRSDYACRIGPVDVHFRFLSANQVEIFDMQIMHNEIPNL